MGMLGTRRRSMTPARRMRIFEAHDGVCGYCHEIIEGCYEVDHAIPLALAERMTMRKHLSAARRVSPDQDVRPRPRARRHHRDREDETDSCEAFGQGCEAEPALTHPFLVRSPDGTVYLRDGTEGGCDEGTSERGTIHRRRRHHGMCAGVEGATGRSRGHRALHQG